MSKKIITDLERNEIFSVVAVDLEELFDPFVHHASVIARPVGAGWVVLDGVVNFVVDPEDLDSGDVSEEVEFVFGTVRRKLVDAAQPGAVRESGEPEITCGLSAGNQLGAVQDFICMPLLAVGGISRKITFVAEQSCSALVVVFRILFGRNPAQTVGVVH